MGRVYANLPTLQTPEKMKIKLAEIVKPVIFWAVIFYGMIAFVNVEIDFRNWHESSRLAFCGFGIVMPFLISFFWHTSQ